MTGLTGLTAISTYFPYDEMSEIYCQLRQSCQYFTKKFAQSGKNNKMRQPKVKKCEVCGKSFIVWVGKGHRIPRKQFVIPTRRVGALTCSQKCSISRKVWRNK